MVGDPYNNSKRRGLRQELQQLTDTYIGDRSHEQIGLIEDLSRTHPHSISLVVEAKPDEESSYRFTCHEFAFDLRESPEIHGIASLYTDIYPSPDWVTWMVENRLVGRHQEEAQDGDLVIYFRGGVAKHSGIWRAGLLRSKWGTCHLWDHGVFEVPANYGDDVRYFERPSREDCIRWFLEYAEIRKNEWYGA